MRKIYIFLICFFALCHISYAADIVHVSALGDFDTIKPDKYFRVKIIKDAQIDDLNLFEGDILNCELKKVTDPKRAKMDAKIYFELKSYQDSKGEHEFLIPYEAKYSKSALNMEEIQKIDKGEVVEKAALTAGDFVVPGFSYAYNFAQGANENSQNNRLKSGIKNVYDNSFLSYVEYGEEIQIKKGDEFYLKVKKPQD